MPTHRNLYMIHFNAASIERWTSWNNYLPNSICHWLGDSRSIYFMRFLMLPYMYSSHQIMQLESETHDAAKVVLMEGDNTKGWTWPTWSYRISIYPWALCAGKRDLKRIRMLILIQNMTKMFPERWILIHLKAGIILWCTLKPQVPSSYLILSNGRISLKIFFILHSGTVTVQARSICSNTESLFPLKTFSPAHG